MKYSLFALAVATVGEARVYARQGLLNATSVATTTIKSSPASAPSLSLPSATKATNTTTGLGSTTTTAPTSDAETCCYIYPHGVGINTWWTSSVDLTVATVITTWLQYNNTLVPGNSTTKTVVNATEFYGAHQMQSLHYTLSPVSATATTTDWFCGGFSDMTCTSTVPTTITRFDYSTIYYNTTNILSGVPNTLLPSNAVLYGRTSIDTTTVTSFPEQSLTIRAPTPYFLFSGLNLHTSKQCMDTYTTTDYTSYTVITPDGGFATQVSSVYPTATITGFKSSWPIIPGSSGDVYINTTFGRAFPDGDYSNFNFTDWAEGVIMGPLPGEVDAYMFRLPEDFPEFLANIPKIKSEFPDVGSCTNFAGDGEPTVHVPVNQLTDTSHVTMTMNGALKPSAGSPKPEPDIQTTTADIPNPVSEIPIIETTASDLDTPEPGPTETPVVAKPGSTLDNPQTTIVAAPTAIIAEPGTGLATPTQGTASPKAPQVGRPGTALDTPDASKQETTTQNIGDIIASVIGMKPPEEANTPDIVTEGNPAFTYVPAPRPEITVGDAVITGNNNNEFVVGGQTLAPGGPAVTEGDNTIELPSQATAVIVNGSPTPIAQPQAPANVPAPEWTFGENTITANSANEFVIASQTITPGGEAVTIAGTTLSLAAGASEIVVNGQTSEIAVPVGAPVTLGGAIATPVASGAYVLPGGQTLSEDGPDIVVAGTTYSLADSGSSVVVNGVASPLPTAGGVAVGGMTELILPGTTLLPGSEVVVSGTTYSLAATGGAFYIDGQSSILQSAQPGSSITLPNGVVATPTVATNIVVGSQTLMPGGPAITISGTTFSISGTEMIIAASGTTVTADLVTSESSTTATTSRTISRASSSAPERSDSTTAPSETDGASEPANTGAGSKASAQQHTSAIALIVALAFCLL
ncbi:hypothetical protein CERZMDRAFT_106301 [Cercospora zeae-maydis SCOH1-5]|uniref:Uncharacterized protein n=1 Tax=Cercospora zeae-maydis SCOH1-5 TaxID=717836 RepID=A0A6A6FFB7_9PEZI|nr:hypothetical protein CERZMDRAFT_106301 [Cercospora zeae-maydis SCOH1-5]